MEYVSIVWQSLNITLFVLSMMLIIDYLNVLTKGIWSQDLQKNKWKQVILGASLGLIPGCLGVYTAVSLYVHNIFGLGAVVAAMIATSGDEAFFMFSILPQTALIIMLVLFGIALLAGFITNFFSQNKEEPDQIKHFDVHSNEPECICFDKHHLLGQLKQITFLRASLLIILAISMVLVVFNFENLLHGLITEEVGHSHEQHIHPVWIGITFAVVMSISFFIIATVSDHFLQEHLVNHIIKKHFLRIFLWILATLIVMQFVIQQFNLESLISDNLWVVLLIAVVAGIIPQSGPHFVFIILFAAGTLPLSILLANSIVQDGHGSLPLLAESPKGFIKVKLINLFVGLVIGAIGLMAGF